MKKYFLFLILILFGRLNAQVVIDQSTDSLRPIFSVELKGDFENATEQLKIYTTTDDLKAPLPVLGEYYITGKMLYFQSKFPLHVDTDFLIVLTDTIIPFRMDSSDQKKTKTAIQKISPNSETIPSNTLAFYIFFETAMIPNPHAYRYIELIDASGKVIPHPWREKSFWINDNQTLVLMVHPGRVKQGIQTTYNLAPMFIEGKALTIRIAPGLLTSDHFVQTESFEKKYTIVQRDTVSPNVTNCNFDAIQEGTRAPLKISFSEPMDFGLIYKWVEIRCSGEKLEGQLTSKNEKDWFFSPKENWKPGNYSVHIQNKCGDLCHNQLDRLFETNQAALIRQFDYVTYTFEL